MQLMTTTRVCMQHNRHLRNTQR